MRASGHDRRLSPRLRLLLAGAALSFGALSAVAARLSPDPRGLGTHEQLGLSPCWILERWGVACPSCGMTTSWSHLLRGQIRVAMHVHAGGVALWTVAMAASCWALASSARGVWVAGRPRLEAFVWLATLLAMVVLLDWGRRLAWP